ncbi:MAG: Zn-dependent exopeptidase M28 [Ruminococcaceae bacterium]|nr:Zn-dependent exopeptidase M28 [Oscillospiraceae bacterium]
MKAYESYEYYDGKVRECCNYAVRSAKNFATSDNNKKRQPCGPDEKHLASILKKDLTQFCDTVVEENFTADQQAYILSNLLIFIFMLISIVLAILSFFFAEYFLFIMIGSIVFSLLAFLGFFGVFGGTSKNVAGINIFATRNPEKEVTKRIIIEANLDAPFKRSLSRKTALILKTLNLFSIILYIVFAILALLVEYDKLTFFASEGFIYIAFPLSLFAFIPLALSRSVKANASFPGVVDNLIGCYTACGTLRAMSQMKLRTENTEVCVLLSGAKNAGNAGVKTFCKMHEDANKAVKTIVISLDSIYNADAITVISSSKKITDLLATASSNSGVELLNINQKHIKKNGSFKVFKKAGIPVATLTSLKEDLPAFFGSAKDNEENINVKAVEAVMKTVLETIYAKDASK